MTSEVVGKVNACSSKVEFKWEIDNFCMMGCKDVGDCLISPIFLGYSYSGKIPREIEWYLKLYPKGSTDDDKDYLSLFLYAYSEQINKVKASCILKILDNEGNLIQGRYFEEIIFDIRYHCSNGLSRFSQRNFIMKSGILSNDEMTIACEITMLAADEEEDEMKLNKEEQGVKEQEDDIESRLEVIAKCEALLNNNKFSDVSLISDGKVVKAHKCILANSSPVFAAMFDTDMKESQENTVEIADVKYDVLVEMIHFVYTGKANNIDELADELLVAADKYKLDVLKKTCVKKMLKSMNIDNVIDRLQIADKLCIEELLVEGIQFIVEEGKSDVTDKPEFKLLSHDIVCEVCCTLSRKYE